MQLYWGDLHNHCNISYGFGSLENALRIAQKHLDFCCITGHAMWPDMYESNEDTAFVVDFHEKGFAKLRKGWQTVQDTVNRFNTERLVTFQSYEMHSCRYGDHHLVSPDADLPLIYRDSPMELVRDCGCWAIAIPHHIGYPKGYRGINWELFDESISPVVEVYSKHGCAIREDNSLPFYHDMGPLDPRQTAAEGLRLHRRFSFVGSTDHHAGFPGSYGDGLTGVWAAEKTREAIWEALLRGHSYAVTGDRIACAMHLNDAMMGDSLAAARRQLRLRVEGDAPIECAVIRKNGRVVSSIVPGLSPLQTGTQRYKLRLEMGWGNSPELFHWEGTIRTDRGRFVRIQPYWRGRNALSPRDHAADSQDATNAFSNAFDMAEDRVQFQCDTVRNSSTLHPQTSAFVLELEADPDAEITLELNGKQHRNTLGELLAHGYAGYMKPWHSHAYKMHTAYAASACQVALDWEDGPEQDRDVYQAEVVQINGSRAFVSPIFVQA